MSDTNGHAPNDKPADEPETQGASEQADFDIPDHLTDAALDGGKVKEIAEARIAELQKEVEQEKDRALRLAAELENTRRRADREKQEAAKYGITNFARDLLSVADNFARALELAPEDPSKMDPEGFKGLINGMKMTEKELITVFERNGIKRIEPAGEKFDPNVHQAIAQVPGNGEPKDHVVDVAAPGFVIGDRVIRAAMVTVSTGAGAAPQAPSED
ncbi:nucleotide exchange factor GrpE [Parvularcula sp. ZS-1/3]|uniref:Protein GrpE n=1 Tax=Parvularcula mediterranea TaxID=2732508 RepID=A0A7Y3RKT4_9PROT|nr:nucleotide exchange factor GrpE [Parvularcula mediterranea]NNU15886.1 nucleotide exchange factor GrpE [Parvularcula mediterranea]